MFVNIVSRVRKLAPFTSGNGVRFRESIFALGGKRFLPVLIFAILVYGVRAEERPLRGVAPRSLEAQPLTVAHATRSPLPASLITEEALSKPLTRRYIAQYTSQSGVTYINLVLERANIFLPFIMEEVEKRGLPPELAYLPVIESSFNITARSRSGAVGLWQFMLNSISPFDMKVNDSVDERRDFIKSTRGALQKLEDNYRALGSWELALAAYNVGLGATNRIVQKTGIKDYWELSGKKQFRQETEHFVPKLIAASYVITNARKYGINVWHERFEWETVPLTRQVSVDIIAEEAGINRELLRRLNSHWLHGISPAGNNQRLIVPADEAEEVSLLLEREDLKLIRYHYHVVRHGDTLWSMSRHYGTALNLIEQHNPGIEKRYLKIGETVVIPAFGDVNLPSRPSSQTAFNGSHIVQKGETLWSLSRRYGTDPQALADANGLRLDQILSVGKTLKVPIIE